MSTENKSSSTCLEIKYSKNNLPVPVVNGIQMHSLYDPEKESLRMAEEFYKTNGSKDNILVFGLGLGYHIDALKVFYDSKGIKVNILVIEPEEAIYKLFLDIRGIPSYQIVSYDNPFLFFNSQLIIDFLCRSPAVFKHPPSFNSNLDFFKKFLAYRPDNTIKEFLQINADNVLKEKLCNFSLDTHILEISNYETLGKYSYLFKMLNAIGSKVNEAGTK